MPLAQPRAAHMCARRVSQNQFAGSGAVERCCHICSQQPAEMCFDVGIVVCGPNEALVISGMCYVSMW